MHWRRWIRPGLLVTVPLTVAALLAKQGDIERDLAGRAAARLAADGLGWAAVDVSGRDVTIQGTAPSIEARQAAERTVAAIEGVRAVANAAKLLPMAAPYVWLARNDGGVLTLSGWVPSDGMRAALLEAAHEAIPDARILDRMALARGAPSVFDVAALFGLERLGGLATGLAALTDATLTISGVAADATALADARQAFADRVPAGVALGPVDILPARADHFVWSVNYDGISVTTSGLVPDQSVRDFLAMTAKATLGDVTVVDAVSVASGEPGGFAEAAAFAIGLLAHVQHGGATLDGRDLHVSGAAKSVDDYGALQAMLEGPLPAGVAMITQAIEPASVSPYGWNGEIGENGVVLAGYVPSAADQAELAGLARSLFPDFTIEDRMRVASGEPGIDWIGAIKFAMGQLARLGRGHVALAEAAYSIWGEAADPEAYSAIVSANSRTLPASLALQDAEVTPPTIEPYRFVVERRGIGVALGGFVPTEDSRVALMTVAGLAFGEGAVSDDLLLAAGAPDGFIEVALAAVSAVNRLAGGRAEVVDRTVAIDGVAYNDTTADEVGRMISAALPEGFVIAGNNVVAGQAGQPVSNEQCNEMLQDVLVRGRIAFEEDEAVLAAHSFGVLERVSAVIGRCPGSRVEVSAHSDSSGAAAANLTRTQTQAEAVVDFIVDAGVKRERLVAVGSGESQPIADNGSEAGRAANRRIEFAMAPADGG